MPWTDITRSEYKRAHDRYPSDLTDGEWELIEPFLPPAKSGGRPRSTDLRDVMDAILFMASSGCQWRMLPKCFPPLSTVQHYFYDWRDNGLWQRINTILVMSARELENREVSSSAKCGANHGCAHHRNHHRGQQHASAPCAIYARHCSAVCPVLPVREISKGWQCASAC